MTHTEVQKNSIISFYKMRERFFFSTAATFFYTKEKYVQLLQVQSSHLT